MDKVKFGLFALDFYEVTVEEVEGRILNYYLVGIKRK